MSITLANGGDVLVLDEDLFWSDEFQWSPTAQSISRGLTGAQIIQTAALVGGRPITLEPDGDDSAWMSRLTLETLLEWSGVPNLVMVLTMRGVDRDVQFRQQEGAPGVEARPIVHFNDVVPGDWYRVKLNFMEV